MGQTIAEKILSRKNLAGTPVKAGDIIDAKVDGVLIGRDLWQLDDHLIKAGFPGGLPRLFDKDRVYLLMEHYQPASDIHYATRNRRTREVARRLGAKHFYDAVPGIEHQMMCDLGFVRPGELVLGNDSHTVMYGALNAASTGIGEADIAYAATFGELWFRVPSTVKVVLTGNLRKYPFAKDIMMYMAATYGDDFGQYKAIEYTGPLAQAMSLDSRMCMSDQSVELGGKFGFFDSDEKTLEYVKARTDLPFDPAKADPDAQYERTVEVNVDDLPFYVSKPHHFKNGVPVSGVAGTKIDQAGVGSCANGRFEDLAIVSRILKGRKVHPRARFLVAPGSYGVLRQCLDAGILQDIIDAGAHLISPGCGVCSGRQGFLTAGEVAITASTRNHKGRMGSPESFVYLGGPATVATSAVAGEIVDPTEVLREIGLI